MKTDSHGRSKEYIKCWNCNGWIGKNLLTPEQYDNECPLCEATGLKE
jgi:Zn finger protein HypA/HybF involved in hydrogenase expression